MLFILANDLHDHDCDGAEYGDPRRCSKHGCVTSDPLGMHDAPCGRCEAEMEDAAETERWLALPEEERARILADLEADLEADRIRRAETDDLPF